MSELAVMRSTKVLITGANGFVGRHLTQALSALGVDCRLAGRTADPNDKRVVAIGEVGPETLWAPALEGVDLVVHLAARAHIMQERASDPWCQFKRVNVDGTAALVLASIAAGVRRLVYFSSVGVHGDSSGEIAFNEKSPLQPHTLYARSKLEGERVASDLAGSKLDLVIVRPPLVYGTGVKGNFLRLLSWIDRGLPIPVESAGNRRSLVNVWDLCSLTVRLLTHQAASGRVWMVSDGEDLSTEDLASRIGTAMSRRVRFVKMPGSLWLLCGALAGRGRQVRALCGSLTVDTSATCAELGWRPAVSVDEAIRRTVQWYVSG